MLLFPSDADLPKPLGPDSAVWSPLRPAWVEMPPRAQFRLSGGDATRFLNGQTTADVSMVGEAEIKPGLLLNRLGKVEVVVGLHRRGPDWMVDCDREMAGVLQSRLEKYIIADDVLLAEEESPDRILHLRGFSPEKFSTLEVPKGARLVSSSRWMRGGSELWLPAETPLPPSWPQGLEASEAAQWCLSRGIPCSIRDLPGLFPHQAGLQHWAVGFAKGCYLGQEVVSRMESAGKVPSRLYFWRSAELPDFNSPLQCWQDGDSQPLGEVSRGVSCPWGGSMGMALLKRPPQSEDSLLIGAAAGGTIGAWCSLVALPLP